MATGIESIAKTLLSQDALKGIAKATGASKDDVSSVLASALPLLLQGASKQSTNAKTAAGFLEALQDHGKASTTNLASFLGKVDADDGAKIIGHLLGSSSTATEKKIAKTSGLDAKQVAQILAVAAPLLMSLLGKKAKASTSKKDTKVDAVSIASALLSNVDVGDVLKAFLK